MPAAAVQGPPSHGKKKSKQSKKKKGNNGKGKKGNGAYRLRQGMVAGSQAPPGMVNQNRVVPFSNPNLTPAGREEGNRHASPGSVADLDGNTRINVFSILQPFESLKKGIVGRVPDSTFRPTFAFASRYVTNIATVANATKFDYALEMMPIGTTKFRSATAFAGFVPSAWANADDPSYSQWSSFVDKIRMVSMEFKLRNTSQLTTIGGAIVIGRTAKNDGMQDGAATFTTLAASLDACVHGMGKPGDVFKGIWLPVMRSKDTSTVGPISDWNFIAYNSVGTSEDTILYFWLSCPVAQTFELEVISHYEALVKPSANQVFSPEIFISDPTLCSRLLAEGLIADPVTSQMRAVESDDGPIASVINDVKTIFGAGKSLYGTAKNAWSYVKGLFSDMKEPEELLEHLLIQGASLELISGLDRALQLVSDQKTNEQQRVVLVKRRTERESKQRLLKLAMAVPEINDLLARTRVSPSSFTVEEPPSPAKLGTGLSASLPHARGFLHVAASASRIPAH